MPWVCSWHSAFYLSSSSSERRHVTEQPQTLTARNLGGLKVRKAREGASNTALMLYGLPGTGKTTLAASACEVPELSPVLILNIENGTQSIEEVYPDVDVIDIVDFNHLQQVFDMLHAKKGAGYRTVILDNLTEGQKQGMEYLFQRQVGQEGAATSFTEFQTGSYADGSYNKNSEQMRKLIRYFRDLPMNVIFVAWAKDYGKGDVTSWGPAFSKTFAGEAPGMVNDVYFYTLKDNKRVLQTVNTNRAVAKDRTRKLPPVIENPTMRIIHEYWTGKRVVTQEEQQQTASGTGSTIRKKR